MEPNNKKRNLIIAIVVVVVLVVLLVWAILAVHKNASPSGSAGAFGPAGVAGLSASSSGSGTLTTAPTNVAVPNAGETSTNGVAVPQTETAAAPGATAKYRSFNITVTSSAFTPSTIAVNVGDTVDLQITASGGNYDFTQPDLNLHRLLPQGQTKTVEFSTMTSGKYTFYCSSCGGPSKGPVGYIIVAATQ